MQSLPEIEVPIGERDLMHRSKDGVATPHLVRIARPVPDGDDWRCSYEIVGSLVARRRYAVGVDAVQALCLALAIIPAELENVESAAGGKFDWLGQTDLGFPLLLQGRRS